MGILQDFLTNVKTIDITDVIVASDRVVVADLLKLIDLMDQDSPAAYNTANEQVTFGIYGGTPTSGNIQFNSVTPSGIAWGSTSTVYDAVEATWQTAFDTGASGVIPGYINGDISVTGGPLTTDPLVIVCGGALAGQNQAPFTIVESLSGGTPGTITVNTNGQPDRYALGTLDVLEVVTVDSLPLHGSVPVVEQFSQHTSPGGNSNYPKPETVRAIIREVAYQEDRAEYVDVLLTVLGLS